jgi:hypothetical protein
MEPMATEDEADAIVHGLIGHLDREDQQAVFLRSCEMTRRRGVAMLEEMEAMAERFKQKMLQ